MQPALRRRCNTDRLYDAPGPQELFKSRPELLLSAESRSGYHGMSPPLADAQEGVLRDIA